MSEEECNGVGIYAAQMGWISCLSIFSGVLEYDYEDV